MSIRFDNDRRTVMTLDAGGTNLKFSAIRGSRILLGPVNIRSDAHDLNLCLGNIVRGFESIRKDLDQPPVAISFAFPGPCDYPGGVIGDLPNLPAFRGGVPLGPILEDRFGIPVFINNDGDLFAYGEAVAGFLPWVNRLFEEAGNPRCYRNLFGVTLGTGFGGGIVHDGELFIGDNSSSGEAWLLRNRLDPALHAEEGASIRAVRRAYAVQSGIDLDCAPEPKTIYEIGIGQRPGNRAAALEAFRRLGRVVGDALAQALTLVDGLAVIGGGLANAWPLFMPEVIAAMNDAFEGGGCVRRLIPKTFNAEDAGERALLVRGQLREIAVPGSSRKVFYDPLARTAVGISRLGTPVAVAIGAYAFALNKLGRG